MLVGKLVAVNLSLSSCGVARSLAAVCRCHHATKLAACLFGVKGGSGRQADGTAGLPPAPEISVRSQHLRFVPSPDQYTAARRRF
jgi:hypothetical protein